MLVKLSLSSRFAGSFLAATAAFLTIGVGSASAEIGNSAAVSTGLGPCVDPSVSPDQVVTPCSAIIRFEDGVSAADRSAVIRDAGAVRRVSLDRFNAAAAVVPDDDAFWRLAGDSRVRAIQPNRRLRALAPPGKCSPWPACKNGGGTGGGDTGSTQVVPSGVARIGARDVAWNGDGVGVAIVDTGLDLANADLNVGTDCFVAFANDDCQDRHGHGTHVGGIVGARDNTIDTVGVAPMATVYAVKVLDDGGFGSNATVAAGLQWVLDNHALVDPPIRVVNMSLGNGEAEGPSDCVADPANDIVRLAIDALLTNGVTVVAAAGNVPSWEVSDTVPAGCPGVISVASTSAEKGKSKCKRLLADIPADTASFFTTDGPEVTISAPGEQKEDNSCSFVSSVGIESLAIGGGTTRKSGTSMAAPHVAGVAALMLQRDSGLYAADVSAAIADMADGIGTAPLDSPTTSYTFDGVREGIVDACALLGCP